LIKKENPKRCGLIVNMTNGIEFSGYLKEAVDGMPTTARAYSHYASVVKRSIGMLPA
jgi:hypothetical protein